jgi:hypothetical protein
VRKPPKILLAVGPTVLMARKALTDRGLDPERIDGLRMITRAHCLRGWTHGTPVAAIDIDDWGLTGDTGAELAACLLALFASGRLRLMQDDDVEQLRAEAA